MRRLICSLTVAIWALAHPALAAFETRATAAWVIDQTTGTVLLEKDADRPLPPASMSKLMTLNMLFEALRDGRVTLETRFNVSAKADAIGGSSMFLTQADRPTVEELIKGIIVQSGNDACIVVAEGLAGTEEAFARLMNDRAQAMGLTGSNFTNSTGWPDPAHRMSMRDLGVLAERLIDEFPEYYGYFAMTEWPYDGRVPSNHQNRNPLLGVGIGADGLKTGHTSEAGYGLVGSAKQGDRRVTFVVTGLATPEARAEETERIVNWAFRQFVQRTVAEEGVRLAEAPVWLGEAERVGMVLGEDLSLLLPATVREGLEAEVSYETPLRAPIAQGQQIGVLRFDVPDLGTRELPLVAETSVAEGGFMVRLRAAAEVLFTYVAGQASPLR